ncbi:zinc finger protein 525-like [Ctenocephalides felis]|uniref:zinc finger protein 525-like n=1 Tax=Ctenocephalides felis TaxID=7515 RepID=UPI000E6E3FA0|nr:zinc finger protein 525-like [Ctenocephalides felis]
MNSVVKIEEELQQESIKTSSYKCDKCNRTFRKLHYLQQHIVNHSHKCTDCSKTLSDASTLEIHLRSHTVANHFVCTKCDKAFTTKYHLDQHICPCSTKQLDEIIVKIEPEEFTIENIQQEIEKEPEECSDDDKTCLKRFMNSIVKIEEELQQELIQKPPYKCDKCNRIFRKLQYLEQHMVNHSHKCTDCSKTFLEASALKIHLKSHTGEKHTKCTKCNKAFNKYDLDHTFVFVPENKIYT